VVDRWAEKMKAVNILNSEMEKKERERRGIMKRLGYVPEKDTGGKESEEKVYQKGS
jgi:hypothetical protein